MESLEYMTFVKEFCDLLQTNGKVLTAGSDIQTHLEEIWMGDVLEFCAQHHYSLIDIDVNVSHNKENNPLVVAIYKMQPLYTLN